MYLCLFLQMQCDSEAGLVFVLGGKIVGTEMCSGLYVYSINKRQWHCVCPDQTSVALTNQITLPRSSHVMLIHPVRLPQCVCGRC